MDYILKTDLITGTRRLFYLVTPSETFAQYVSEVPEYFEESIVFFVVAIFLELFVAVLQGREHVLRFSDGITSITGGFDLYVYTWIHRQLPSMNLQWDSTWAWFFCFFFVEFFYYWFHRMGHEVNIIWAAHQVHHSSEDFNLTTALRQGITQRLFIWVFFLPMAPFVPPSTALVHAQFNTLYQFWIHTELIDSLGPLEYIMNTPSHHRVHHGRNRYCIDKNYGGTFIIFDRIFGTFEAERKTERVVYGLVHPVNTYNPIYVQFFHFHYIWKRFWEVDGISNKLSVIFKGPGWEPGKPRTGLIEDIPDVQYPQPRYDPQLPVWLTVYVVLHTLINVFVFHIYAEESGSMTQLTALVGMVYLLYSFTSIGIICDNKWYAPLMEMMRCLFFVVAFVLFNDRITTFAGLDASVFYALSGVYLMSAFMWLPKCLQDFNRAKVKQT